MPLIDRRLANRLELTLFGKAKSRTVKPGASGEPPILKGPNAEDKYPAPAYLFGLFGIAT